MQHNPFSRQSDDYHRVEKAIRFLEDHYRKHPKLDEIAASVHLSKFHFQRLFKRWVGISAVQFMQYLTLAYAKRKLAESHNILDTSLDAGLSGPARLHDLFVTFEAMTPGEYKRKGAGLDIAFGFQSSPFGECLIAITHRGICHFGFVSGTDRKTALEWLQQNWPEASFTENPSRTREMVYRIFSVPSHERRPFHLLLKGTNFQINVWQALLNLPRGSIWSYQDIAVLLDRPRAFRAVANAVAANPIAYLIPCHRVIAKSGHIHRYRWGTARKKAILGWEFARQEMVRYHGVPLE